MSLGELIEPLRRLPVDSRSFACDERFAAVHFGLDADTLDELVASGLPSVLEDGGRRFEYGDLHFVGLRLQSAAAFQWTASRWAEGLVRFAAAPRTHVEIAYVPQLRDEDAPVPGVVLLPDGEQREVHLRDGVTAATVRVELVGETPRLPPSAARIVRDFAGGVAFYQLPPALQGDVALARRTGLADCQTAAHAIAEEWCAAGFDGRVSHGILVSVPFSIFHAWAELRCDGGWIPADPLMLGVMRDLGGLDGERWPIDRSPLPVLSRMPTRLDAAIMSARGPIEATLLTEVIQ